MQLPMKKEKAMSLKDKQKALQQKLWHDMFEVLYFKLMHPSEKALALVYGGKVQNQIDNGMWEEFGDLRNMVAEVVETSLLMSVYV